MFMNDGPLITKNSNKIFRNLEIYFSKTSIFFLGDDGLIKIWDRRSLKESNPHPVGVFAGHVDGITFIGMYYQNLPEGFVYCFDNVL